jgi:threonine/homoserine/homoserine lactone efflux protein
VHILVSIVVDGFLVTVAGALAVWLATRPAWMRAQRWFLGSAFAGLAVWLALTPRHANAG